MEQQNSPENKPSRKRWTARRVQRVTAAFLSIPLLVFVIAAGGNAQKQAAPASEARPAAQAQAQAAPAASDTVWIDVRTPQEFAGGHLPGAINLPVDGFAQTFPTLGLSRDAVVALYCRSGGRAGRALAIARELGYAKAYNAGGYEALIRD